MDTIPLDTTPLDTIPFTKCSLPNLALELQIRMTGELDPQNETGNTILMRIILALQEPHAKVVWNWHPAAEFSSPITLNQKAWISMLHHLLIRDAKIDGCCQHYLFDVYSIITECAEKGYMRTFNPSPAVQQKILLLNGIAALKQQHSARVLLRLCNAQNDALVRIQFASPIQHQRMHSLLPFYDTAMLKKLRLKMINVGGKVIERIFQGNGKPMLHKCNILMDFIVRRIAAGREVTTPEKFYANAIVIRRTYMPNAIKGIAKVSLLEKAIEGGHLLSRAHLAKMLIWGEYYFDIERNAEKAFLLVRDGALGGCHCCQGVLAFCYLAGIGCKKNIPMYLELAKKSAAPWHNAS
jgi:hypothetical protein